MAIIIEKSEIDKLIEIGIILMGDVEFKELIPTYYDMHKFGDLCRHILYRWHGDTMIFSDQIDECITEFMNRKKEYVKEYIGEFLQ